MCPVCGGERFEARAAAEFTVKRCLDCGLLISAITPGSATNYADVGAAAYLQSIGRVRHTVYFDLSTLTRFLTGNGFDVVASRYLDEVPAGTVADWLTLDGRMSRWTARVAVPLFFAINLIERMRGKSDALLVLARPRANAT